MTARGLDVLLRREPVAHGGHVVLREVTVGNDTFKVYPSQSKELIRIVERDAPEMGNGTKWACHISQSSLRGSISQRIIGPFSAIAISGVPRG